MDPSCLDRSSRAFRALSQVVVPEPEPFDPEDGILHDPTNPVCVLPTTHAAFSNGRCGLISPSPAAQLEADRTECFELVAPPGCGRVGLFAPDGSLVVELDPASSQDDPRPTSASSRDNALESSRTFRKTLQLPRVPFLQLRGFVHLPELSSEGWAPLLTIRVAPKSQHIVFQEEDIDVPEIDPSDPAAFQVRFRTTTNHYHMEIKVKKISLISSAAV